MYGIFDLISVNFFTNFGDFPPYFGQFFDKFWSFFEIFLLILVIFATILGIFWFKFIKFWSIFGTLFVTKSVEIDIIHGLLGSYN